MRFWTSLSNKERQLALIIVPVLFVILFYFGFIRAASNDITEHQATLSDVNKSLIWMQEKQNEVSALKRNTVSTSNASVMLIFNQHGKRHGIHQSIKSITPSSNNRVNIKMESVNYTSLIETLNTMSIREGISIEELRITRLGKNGIVNNGIVNAKLVLVR